jgi:hypothetical protein
VTTAGISFTSPAVHKQRVWLNSLVSLPLFTPKQFCSLPHSNSTAQFATGTHHERQNVLLLCHTAGTASAEVTFAQASTGELPLFLQPCATPQALPRIRFSLDSEHSDLPIHRSSTTLYNSSAYRRWTSQVLTQWKENPDDTTIPSNHAQLLSVQDVFYNSHQAFGRSTRGNMHCVASQL